MNFADGPRQLLPRGNRVGCTEGKGFVCVQVPGSETWGKWWLFFFFFFDGTGRNRLSGRRKSSHHPHFRGVSSAALWPLLWALSCLARSNASRAPGLRFSS